jgi:hypothetical protein
MKINQMTTDKTTVLGRVKALVGSVLLGAILLGASLPTKSEAAYYDNNYDMYAYYVSLHYDYGYSYSTYVLGYAYPYYYYYYAGLSADYYSWVDSNGFKQMSYPYNGSGAPDYDYWAYWGDYYWWNY